MSPIIVFGNDHTNTIGVIQSIGEIGYTCIGLLWGQKTGFVKSSKYTERIITAENPQSCIERLLQIFPASDVRIPIIACCDMAALTLECNAERLKGHFLFEYSKHYSLSYIAKKENQVMLAAKVGLSVPKSWNLEDSKLIPQDICFPCIIKPLISCEGAKSDIRICRTEEFLKLNLDSLNRTQKVLLQQYIEKDYEISILGCSLSNGKCIIPAVEYKLTLYPKHVGLECLANLQPIEEGVIKENIERLISTIGYVGLFSVEMMHCKDDGLFYFTEINLRNDGANAFVKKYGANLPLNHVEDLMGLPLTEQQEFNPGYYIWDMHHLRSLLSGDISVLQWIKEIAKSKGFLMYDRKDKKPFFRQYIYMLSKLFRLVKATDY